MPLAMTKPVPILGKLITEQVPVVAPGVFDGLSAAMARRAGFSAVYASGGAIARSMGLPDLGLVGMAEMTRRLAQIVEAAQVPVMADADAGYGTALHVRRTVRSYESAGVAGLHIEDQGFPKRCGHLEGKSLAPASEMIGKIEAAVEARRDSSFQIVARSECNRGRGLRVDFGTGGGLQGRGRRHLVHRGLRAADRPLLSA